MRPHSIVLPALALALVIGCQETPENKKAKKEIKEASGATVDALKAQKDEYKKQLEADLDKLNDSLKDFKERAAKAKDEAKVKMNKQIEALQEQHDKLRGKLKDKGGDTKEAWEEFKKGLDKAKDDLKESFEKAKKSFD